ncbi:MAG: HEPN domain-containing protein [Actinomycetota bacterium]|nr:HEPN domain-containing protein [Actinomycetota bacterium]
MRQQADGAAQTAALAAAGGRHDWACFLCEQAAQLGLKGLLRGVGAEAWGHDLVVLHARAVEELAQAWPVGLDEPAARLARHYIPTRHPDAHASGSPSSHYTPADAIQAAEDAHRLLGAADDAW